MPKHESAELPAMPAAEYENPQEQANVNRIVGLLNWGQKLSETDRESYFRFLLRNWERSKKVLEQAKEDEMAWRKHAVKAGFDTEAKGTQHHELDNGFKATAVVKINYGFIKRPDGKRIDAAAIDNALTMIERRTPQGAYIAEHLVKWNPDLSLTEYNKLPAEDKAIIDTVIVTKEATPTLEIREPKGTRK